MKFFPVCFLLISFQILSQTQTIDSLKTELNKNPTSAIEKIDLLISIGSKLNIIRNKDSYQYLLEAENLLKDHPDQDKLYKLKLEKMTYHDFNGVKDSVIQLFEEVENYALINNKRRLLNRSYAFLSVFYNRTNNRDKAIEYAIKNLEFSETDEEFSIVYQTLTDIYITKRAWEKCTEYAELALEWADKLNSKSRRIVSANKLAKCKMFNGDIEEAEKLFNETLILVKETNNKKREAFIYGDLGQIYFNVKKDTLQAISYFEKAYSIGKELGDTRLISSISLPLSYAYLNYGRVEEGENIIRKFYNQAISRQNYDYAFQLARSMSLHFEKTNADSALVWNKKFNAAKDSIAMLKKQKEFKEIETKYEVSETQEKNEALTDQLALETQKRNRLVLISLLILGILISLALLIFKNLKKKQKITEQEKEIEKQKALQAIKEQEIQAIDAMLKGQAEERKKIASELHDSVGANLVAAKMHFSHLKNTQIDSTDLNTFFTKTETLLDQAYKEVRSISHQKNQGLLAREGLLPAIENLVKNASLENELNIQLTNFGINERLDNVLEINLFRIIQELISNVIKHANASEAQINITHLGDAINLIVEDNGSGFEDQTQSLGIGLKNINERVALLNGSISIDSKPTKGTHIIIDIPFAKPLKNTQ